MIIVFSSVGIRTLKSLPNNIMPTRVRTSIISTARFWNKNSLSCLEPTGVVTPHKQTSQGHYPC
jgi:hypothetical protein